MKKVCVIKWLLVGLFFPCLTNRVEAATFQSIGAPAGASSIDVVAISGDGLVVTGNIVLESGEAKVFRWTSDQGIDILDHRPAINNDRWNAYDLSADGSLILGGWSNRRGLWTVETGWQELPITGGEVMSSDGSVIAGQNASFRAFHWTSEAGTTLIDTRNSSVSGVSGDGSVVVGTVRTACSGSTCQEAYRWTSETGLVGLGTLETDQFAQSQSSAISRNGRVIVGVDRTAEFNPVPYRWTQETGMVALAPPVQLTDNRWPTSMATSYDGNVLIGNDYDNGRGGIPIIWDSLNGMRYFDRAMVLEYDLGFSIAGWGGTRGKLTPLDIADDGQTIIGTGLNPIGVEESWIIRLDKSSSSPQPPIPGVVEIRGVAITSSDVLGSGELNRFVANGKVYDRDDLIQGSLSEFSAISNNVTVVVPTGSGVPSTGSRGALLTQDFNLNSGIVNPATVADGVTLTFPKPLVNGPGPDLVVFEIKRSDFEKPYEFGDPFQLVVNGVTGVVGGSSWGPQLGSIDIDAYSREGGHPTNLAELENGNYVQPARITDMVYYGVAIDFDEFGLAPFAEVSTVNFGGIGFGITSFDPVLFMGINSAIPEPSSVFLATLALTGVFGRFTLRHSNSERFNTDN